MLRVPSVSSSALYSTCSRLCGILCNVSKFMLFRFANSISNGQLFLANWVEGRGTWDVSFGKIPIRVFVNYIWNLWRNYLFWMSRGGVFSVGCRINLFPFCLTVNSFWLTVNHLLVHKVTNKSRLALIKFPWTRVNFWKIK